MTQNLDKPAFLVARSVYEATLRNSPGILPEDMFLAGADWTQFKQEETSCRFIGPDVNEKASKLLVLEVRKMDIMAPVGRPEEFNISKDYSIWVWSPVDTAYAARLQGLTLENGEVAILMQYHTVLEFYTIEKLEWEEPTELEEMNAEATMAFVPPDELDQIIADASIPVEPDLGVSDEEDQEEPVTIQDYFLPTSHECDAIFVRLYNNATKVIQLQNLKATLELKLRRAKAMLERDCNAAINNWDSKEKFIKDPSRPSNDGSNDQKRDAISRELFSAQFAEVDLYQIRIDDISIELLDPTMYRTLAEIEVRNIQTQLDIAKEARLAGLKFYLSDQY